MAGPKKADAAPTTKPMAPEAFEAYLLVEVSMLELPGVFAVYPANRKPPAKIRAVIDFLVERFKGTPPWERGLPVF